MKGAPTSPRITAVPGAAAAACTRAAAPPDRPLKPPIRREQKDRPSRAPGLGCSATENNSPSPAACTPRPPPASISKSNLPHRSQWRLPYPRVSVDRRLFHYLSQVQHHTFCSAAPCYRQPKRPRPPHTSAPSLPSCPAPLTSARLRIRTRITPVPPKHSMAIF